MEEKLKKFLDETKEYFLLCYFRKSIKFGKYNYQTIINENLDDALEIHIFNYDIEFRVIKNYKNEFIYCLIDDEKTICNNIEEKTMCVYDDIYKKYIDEDMLIYGSEEYIKKESEKTYLSWKGNIKSFDISISKNDFEKGIFLKVRNYLDFDSDDMLKVKNYRLCGLYVGKENRLCLNL